MKNRDLVIKRALMKPGMTPKKIEGLVSAKRFGERRERHNEAKQKALTKAKFKKFRGTKSQYKSLGEQIREEEGIDKKGRSTYNPNE